MDPASIPYSKHPIATTKLTIFLSENYYWVEPDDLVAV